MATTGFSPFLLKIGANAMRSAIKGFQLHTDDPGVGGAANKSSAAIVVPVFTVVDANGGWDLASPMVFNGGTPNGPVKYMSALTASDGTGSWCGNFALTGDLTFDSNGAYTVESLPVTGTSS